MPGPVRSMARPTLEKAAMKFFLSLPNVTRLHRPRSCRSERALATERRDGDRALVGSGEADRSAVLVAGGHDHEHAGATGGGDGGPDHRIGSRRILRIG